MKINPKKITNSGLSYKPVLIDSFHMDGAAYLKIAVIFRTWQCQALKDEGCTILNVKNIVKERFRRKNFRCYTRKL